MEAINKYGSVQELRSTFSHMKSINQYSFLFFQVCELVCGHVNLYMVCKQDVTKKYKGNMVTCRIAAGLKKKNLNGPGYRVATKLKINIF